MTFFKRQIPRAHMEPMRGRLQDNDMYIEKEGDLTTWGQKPDQGRRSDIVGLKRKIMQGHHPMDLAIGKVVYKSDRQKSPRPHLLAPESRQPRRSQPARSRDMEVNIPRFDFFCKWCCLPSASTSEQ